MAARPLPVMKDSIFSMRSGWKPHPIYRKTILDDKHHTYPYKADPQHDDTPLGHPESYPTR